MLNLHYAPGTISAAVAITLHEAGLEFSTTRVDFKSAEQTTAAYHSINPKGRVPALETPQGVLTETGAILEYIAAIAPNSTLVPTDPFAAANMRALMYYLASTMHINHAHGMRGARWASQQSSFKDMAAKVPETMAASCAYVETLITGPLVMGTNLTLADPYLFTVCSWLKGDGVDISAYPKLAAFFASMKTRPSVIATARAGIIEV
jgi:glutathione S-transferase